MSSENWMLTSQGKQEVLRTAKSQVCLQEGLCLQVGFGEILQRWWETETKKSQYFEQLIELIQFRVSQGSVENPVLVGTGQLLIYLSRVMQSSTQTYRCFQ